MLPEPDSPKALSLESDYRNQIRELIAPDVLPIEIAHALARAERKNILLPGEAAKRLANVLGYPPDLFSYLPLLPRAMAIALNARIGVYDCLYVALAERESCELITAAQRLVNAFQGQFPIVALSSL
ncbi:MAG TPA: type II toxin-antitoxin system VapC family toxin [Planctomycetaceae bacterium]